MSKLKSLIGTKKFYKTVIAIAFLVAAINGIFMIPLLRRLKFGQEIREEGPAWHAKKSGTPTMGGIAIAIAVVVAMILTGAIFKIDTSLVVCLALGSLLFGVVGFTDDYIKVVKKRNLGLTSIQKFSGQLIVSVIVSRSYDIIS